MRLALILAFIAVAGCATNTNAPRVRAYTGETRPFTTVVVADTRKATNASCLKYAPTKASYNTVACVVIVNGVSTIFIPVPQNEDDYNAMHHEVGHLMDRDWHK